MKILWNLKKEHWETIADRFHAPMQQRWLYGSVHQSMGGELARASIFVNDEPIAICQFIRRKFGGLLPVSLATYGPVFKKNTDKGTRKNILTALSRTDPFQMALFTLNDTIQSWRHFPLMTPTNRALIHLNTPEKMRAAMKQKWRNALNNGLKNKLDITSGPCGANDLCAIIALDKLNQFQKQYHNFPKEFLINWRELSPDDLYLTTARMGNTTVATALFLIHGNTATYQIAHTAPVGRPLNASRLLLWHAMTVFSQKEMAQIDLGLLDTENSANLARFKLGSGAVCKRGGGTVIVF